jgi:hypothetical protein
LGGDLKINSRIVRPATGRYRLRLRPLIKVLRFVAAKAGRTASGRT